MKLALIGGAYKGRSSNVSSETCINLFKEGDSLVGTPGDSVFNSSYSGPVRGGIEYNDLAYFVIGNTLYEFNSAGGGASRGTIGTATGRVSMAHNGVRSGANQQIFIADGTSGYIYDNATSTLAEISDADMTSADTVVFFDGYFLFNQTNTDRFWQTAAYDGTSIVATDFYTAEGDPDKAVSLLTDRRQLFVFGQKTTEGYYNSGDADSTFQRFQGGFSQTGCAAAFSAARFDNAVMWLSRNEKGDGEIVRMADGYQPVTVSTHEINYQISKYTTISDAFAYAYRHEGHEFYVITFPTANVTWVYDALEKEWHHRAHNIGGVFPSRERYNCHVFAFGKHLFGDYSNGKIYALSGTSATVNGERIERERATVGIADEDEGRVRIHSFQLDMQEGIGDQTTDDDGLIYLSYSKDGGHTWSNEVSRDAGDTGEYDKRIIWRRLGIGRNWIFRIRTWTPQRVVFKGAIVQTYEQP